jgi:aconitate hydratase
MLRKHGVVDKFVEFFGPGMAELSVPDRATIANMAPEYGATMGFFPIDSKTLDYLRLTAATRRLSSWSRSTAKARASSGPQAPEPEFTRCAGAGSGSNVEPSLAGPKRPQDRVALSNVQGQWRKDLVDVFGKTCARGCQHQPHGPARAANRGTAPRPEPNGERLRR